MNIFPRLRDETDGKIFKKLNKFLLSLGSRGEIYDHNLMSRLTLIDFIS